MRNRRPDRLSRQTIPDRPSRLAIFARRQRRMVRPALLVLVLLVLIGGTGIALRNSMSEASFAPMRARLIQLMPLHIAHITITGRNLTTEASLMQALGTTIGQPIFGFSVKAARDRIDALPFVDHAVVARHMPDTIIIRLTERTPFAVWQDHGQFELISRTGERVADQGMTGKDAQAFMQLPLVVGDGANLAAATLIDALAQQPDIRAFVTAAVRVGGRRWNLTLKDGTIIMLPEGEETPALARLAQYQNSMKLLERPVISIDMRLPDRMVIHQPPAPEPPKDAPDARPDPKTNPKPPGTQE